MLTLIGSSPSGTILLRRAGAVLLRPSHLYIFSEPTPEMPRVSVPHSIHSRITEVITVSINHRENLQRVFDERDAQDYLIVHFNTPHDADRMLGRPNHPPVGLPIVGVSLAAPAPPYDKK